MAHWGFAGWCDRLWPRHRRRPEIAGGRSSRSGGYACQWRTRISEANDSPPAASSAPPRPNRRQLGRPRSHLRSKTIGVAMVSARSTKPRASCSRRAVAHAAPLPPRRRATRSAEPGEEPCATDRGERVTSRWRRGVDAPWQGRARPARSRELGGLADDAARVSRASRCVHRDVPRGTQEARELIGTTFSRMYVAGSSSGPTSRRAWLLMEESMPTGSARWAARRPTWPSSRDELRSPSTLGMASTIRASGARRARSGSSSEARAMAGAHFGAPGGPSSEEVYLDEAFSFWERCELTRARRISNGDYASGWFPGFCAFVALEACADRLRLSADPVVGQTLPRDSRSPPARRSNGWRSWHNCHWNKSSCGLWRRPWSRPRESGIWIASTRSRTRSCAVRRRWPSLRHRRYSGSCTNRTSSPCAGRRNYRRH